MRLLPDFTTAPSVPVQNRFPVTSMEHSPPKLGPTASKTRSPGLVESLFVNDNVGWVESTLVFDARIASPAPTFETSTSHPGSLPSKSEKPLKKFTPDSVGTTEVSIANIGVCPPVLVKPVPLLTLSTPVFFSVRLPP